MEDESGRQVMPKTIRNIAVRHVSQGEGLQVSVAGGVRYSLNRRDSHSVVLTLWDTVIYDLRLLRSIDLRHRQGSIRYVRPEVEGSLRSHVNLIIEHESGVQVFAQGSGDTLTVVVKPTGRW